MNSDLLNFTPKSYSLLDVKVLCFIIYKHSKVSNHSDTEHIL